MTERVILVGHWGGSLMNHVERVKQELQEFGKVQKCYEARSRLRSRGLYVTCKKREV